MWRSNLTSHDSFSPCGRAVLQVIVARVRAWLFQLLWGNGFNYYLHLAPSANGAFKFAIDAVHCCRCTASDTVLLKPGRVTCLCSH